MAIQSAKDFSVSIIKMLNVPEEQFDYEQYSKTVQDYSRDLLVEALSRCGPKTTAERQTALMREYCQRFDSAVHRIELARTLVKPSFPLFKGAVFVRFIHAVKETTKDPSSAVREIMTIAEGLPYRSDNPLIKVMLDDLTVSARKAADEATEKAERAITNILKEVKDRPGLHRAVTACQNVVFKSQSNQGRLELHAMLEIGKTAARLEVSDTQSLMAE